jgi:hypothetical protein
MFIGHWPTGGFCTHSAPRGEAVMTNRDLKIFVDATRPATLNDGTGKQTDFATWEAAVLAWRALSPVAKIRATVKLIGGPVYAAHQIDRLHHAPKPEAAE